MIKKTLRKWCPNTIREWYADTKYYLRFKLYPQGLASELFRGLLGYEMNWKNPQDLNEKINWMKFYYNTTEWTLLADKYLVRDYVKERVGGDILVKLYGVWERVEDIDFDKLPSKFVIKTNHGAGTILPVVDKSQLDIEKTRNKLRSWLKTRYGYTTVEPHYLGIHPLIIAEEYLENKDDFSTSLVDYKIYCFSGKPFCILVCTDRIIGSQSHYSYYDCDWNPINEILKPHLRRYSVSVPKPQCLQELLGYAAALSAGHPQVRVDFYIVNNHVYFGEMTFTSEGGYDGDITREFSNKMGKLIKIPV